MCISAGNLISSLDNLNNCYVCLIRQKRLIAIEGVHFDKMLVKSYNDYGLE